MHKSWLISLVVSAVTLGGVVAGAVFIWQRLDTVQAQLRTLTSEVSTLQSLTQQLAPVATTGVTLASSSAVPGSAAQPSTMAATVSELRTLIQAMSDRLDDVEAQSKQKSAPSTTTPVVASQPREYLIFLGSGQTVNRNWTDITAAGVNLNINAYRNVREVKFEAGLAIINGEAHARLYDQTTGKPFYSTEVYNNTSVGSWVTSTKFALPAGEHYYTVQLRSSSGELAQLIGARIKIVAD